MKLVLHIGTGKTGTTAVQTHLYANRAWLAQRGICVPGTGLGRDNGHASLLGTLDGGELTRLAAELRAARAAGQHTAIISWEGMGFYRRADIQRLARGLRWDDVHVLVYLREQADIVQSGYLQELKTGPQRFGIADFSAGAPGRARLAALLYRYAVKWDYARLLRNWARALPGLRFIAREYRPQLLAGGNVVDDVLAALGTAADAGFTRTRNTSNLSLDVESAVILNALDRDHRDPQLRRTQVYTLLSLVNAGGAGSRYFLSPRQVAAVRRRYRRGNAAVPALVGGGLPALFAEPPACARTVTGAALAHRVAARQQRFDALMQTPMLFAARQARELPPPQALAGGWGPHEDWGAWSAGAQSAIRFRVPFWITGHDGGEVVILLNGRYRDGHAHTGVSVNGIDCGRLDLRRESRAIRLPVPALGGNEMVEVRLSHAVTGAGAATAAFGIERLAIRFDGAGETGVPAPES